MSPDDLRAILNDPRADKSLKTAARAKLHAMGEPETTPEPTNLDFMADQVASGLPPMLPADFQAQAPGEIPMAAPESTGPQYSPDEVMRQDERGGLIDKAARFMKGVVGTPEGMPPVQPQAPMTGPAEGHRGGLVGRVAQALKPDDAAAPQENTPDPSLLQWTPRSMGGAPAGDTGAPPGGGGTGMPSDWRVRREMRRGEEALKRASDASDEEQGLLEEAAMLEHNAAEAQKRIYQDHANDLRTFQGHRKEALADATARLKNFSDEYSAAAARGTGPSASLIERETRDAVIANVVMGLGALAQIVTQGNTNALAPMATGIMDRADKAIRRDIQAKLNRLDSLKTATSLADRQLQTLRANFNDDKAFMDYMVQVQIDRDVVPKLKQAASSKNMAAAAGARAGLAVAESNARNSRAQIERALLGDAQQNALMRMKLEAEQQMAAQDDLRFAPGLGEAYKTEVRKEFNNIRDFSGKLGRFIQLREEMGKIARTGDVGAWITGNLAKVREYNSIGKELFKKSTDMGKALTFTEIKFGEDILGNPFSVLTDADALRAALIPKLASDVKNFMAHRSGVQLTQSSRAQLEQILRYSGGGGPAPRNAPTTARSKR